jgi:hypothetical protein
MFKKIHTVKTPTIVLGKTGARTAMAVGGTSLRRTPTWTTYVNRCVNCSRPFRISREAIDETAGIDLENWTLWRQGKDPMPTLQDSINSIEWCLECATGEKTREHDLPEFVFRAADLLNEMIRLMVNEINNDLETGVLPKHVENFSHLHDYTDANMYGLSVIDHVLADDVWCSWGIENIASRAQDVANAYLEARCKAIRALNWLYENTEED